MEGTAASAQADNSSLDPATSTSFSIEMYYSSATCGLKTKKDTQAWVQLIGSFSPHLSLDGVVFALEFQLFCRFDFPPPLHPLWKLTDFVEFTHRPCCRLRFLLESKRLDFEEYDVCIDQMRLKEMRSRSGDSSLPQLFVNGVYAGVWRNLL